MRIRTGFDKSFPRNGLVFVIWRAEYSLLSTLEQFLYQTEWSFWLVSHFLDTISPLFFSIFWLFGHIEVIFCVTVTKFWPSKFLGQFHTVLPNVSQSLNHQNWKPTGQDISPRYALLGKMLAKRPGYIITVVHSNNPSRPKIWQVRYN